MNGFQFAIFIPMAVAVLLMGRQAPKVVNFVGGLVLGLGFLANALYCGFYF